MPGPCRYHVTAPGRVRIPTASIIATFARPPAPRAAACSPVTLSTELPTHHTAAVSATTPGTATIIIRKRWGGRFFVATPYAIPTTETAVHATRTRSTSDLGRPLVEERCGGSRPRARAVAPAAATGAVNGRSRWERSSRSLGRNRIGSSLISNVLNGARSTPTTAVTMSTAVAPIDAASVPASVRMSGTPAAAARRDAGTAIRAARARMAPTTARKVQWTSPAATNSITAPPRPGSPPTHRANAASPATTNARRRRFATFSPTNLVAPSTVPAIPTAIPHRHLRTPNPADANAPRARANTETRTSGRIAASSSCDRPVTEPRTEDSNACPGRTAVSSGPRPCSPTYLARHTYQEVSNPTGTGNRRIRYTRK